MEWHLWNPGNATPPSKCRGEEGSYGGCYSSKHFGGSCFRIQQSLWHFLVPCFRGGFCHSCVCFFFFHPAWVKEDPKNESVLCGRHWGDPEHAVKSTGSGNRASKFKSQLCSTWAGQSWVSFFPSPCLSFLTSKVGKLKIALHHRA